MTFNFVTQKNNEFYFFFQLVTYKVIKRSLFALWLSAVILTYLPFFGIGIYYKDGKCARYREATEPTDVAYAYSFLTFGKK